MSRFYKVICCLATVALVVACTGKTVEDHIELAREYTAAGDQAAAIIELKNALQKDGASAEARWLLGREYLEQGDSASATKELRRALDLGWPADEVLPPLGEALLNEQSYPAIRELSPDGLPPESAARLLAVQGVAELAQGEVEDAAERISEALAAHAANAPARRARALLLAQQGEKAEAIALVETLLGEDAGDWQSWSMLADLTLQEGQWQEALEAMDQVLQLRPSAFSIRASRALLHLQLGNTEAAEEDAARLLKQAPEHAASHYVQGALQFQHSAYQASIDSLTKASPTTERYPLGLLLLGIAHLQEGNQGQANTYAERFHNANPEHPGGRKLLAALRLEQREFDKARELLEPVLNADPEDVSAINLMANALLASQETDRGIELLEQAARLQPDSPAARVRLGASLMMGGQGELATEELTAALALNPQFQQADLLLITGHLAEKNYEAAISAAQAYRRRNPAAVQPNNVLGKVYMAAGRQQEATSAFERALSLAPADPSANHNLARMALESGDFDAARQRYAVVLKEHRNHLATLLYLADLSRRAGEEEEVVDYLQRATDSHPNALRPRVLLGRYYLASGAPQKVPLLFAGLSELQKRSPQVLLLTAQAQLATNDNAGAGYSLDRLAKSAPESPEVLTLQAAQARRQGDWEAAIRYAEQAFEQAPAFKTADNLANYREQSGDVEGALALRRQWAEAHPGDTAALMGLADQLQRMRHTDAAQQYYLAATELQPDNIIALNNIAWNLREADPATALTYARKAASLAPDSAPVLDTLAVIEYFNGEYGRAEVAIKRALAKWPDQPSLRYHHAMIAAKLNRSAKSEK